MQVPGDQMWTDQSHVCKQLHVVRQSLISLSVDNERPHQLEGPALTPELQSTISPELLARWTVSSPKRVLSTLVKYRF
jgi:hypothetical protein